VADAMTGQDAVKSADEFTSASHHRLILTKMDGDAAAAPRSPSARHRAALKFVGAGESSTLSNLLPDRVASRILAWAMSLLLEKVEQTIDQKTTEDMQQNSSMTTHLGTSAISSARSANSAPSSPPGMMPGIGPLRTSKTLSG